MTAASTQCVAPAPLDEPERLAALRELEILDTPPEEEFEALVRAASELVGAPISLVSLVDEERQWFKARLGLDATSTPREQAFCAHAIVGEQAVFEVPDALADPRFAENPLVTGAPDIRFYAGAPLRTSTGHALGTLCVIDRAPRRLSAAQREGLRALADRAARALELRGQFRALGREAPEDGGQTRRDGGQTRQAAGSETMVSALHRAPEAAPAMEFGRYTITRRVGAGAMATVYAARDAALDREVALKLIRDSVSEEGGARVAREARALARICHPNVVQIFEVGRYGGQAFVAMELVEGWTLGEWQRARERPVDELLDMYIQAGQGLAAAHAAGIVHRDFKAENVLVGDDGRARVADFGLARVLGEKTQVEGAEVDRAASPELTQVGTVMGTPAYMSPEQHRGAVVDERSDQFNFCAALYEGIYKVRPFEGRTLEEIRACATAGVVTAPPAWAPRYPKIDAVLMRGLAMRAEERWPSLAELVAALHAAAPQAAAAKRPAVGGRWILGGAVAGLVASYAAAGLAAAAGAGPGRVLATLAAVQMIGLIGAAVAWRLKNR